jgi:hypothetical protein
MCDSTLQDRRLGKNDSQCTSTNGLLATQKSDASWGSQSEQKMAKKKRVRELFWQCWDLLDVSERTG